MHDPLNVTRTEAFATLRGRRILQIVPRLDSGGAERSTIEVSQALHAAGAHALIIGKAGRWSDWAQSVGAVLHNVDLGAKNPLVLRHFFWLRRLLQTVDIVHTRSRLPSWMTWLALKSIAKAARPRWVTTVHGLHSVSRYSAIQHAGELAIAVSQTAKSYVQQHYPAMRARAMSVIEPGADCAVFYPGQNTPAWRDALFAEFPTLRGKQLLLLAGRGTRLKGHVQAIALLALLSRAHPDTALLFAGIVEADRADYLKEVKALARALGVENAVVYSAARNDLPALYAQAALVLQLSNRPESFGRTVAEALLCGAQVLGVAHGGVGEQLERAFPAGLAPADAPTLLAERAAALLTTRCAANLSAVPTTAQMQYKTLCAYAEILQTPRG